MVRPVTRAVTLRMRGAGLLVLALASWGGFAAFVALTEPTLLTAPPAMLLLLGGFYLAAMGCESLDKAGRP